MLRSNRKGQSTLEYTLIIAAVVAALVAMAGYVRKSVQGRVRASTDQIGEQFAIKDKFVMQRQTFGGKNTASGETMTKEDRDAAEYYLGGGINTTIQKKSNSEVVETQENDTWDVAPTLDTIQ